MQESITRKIVTPFLPLTKYIFIRIFNFSAHILKRCSPEMNARKWSNTELRKFAPLFYGNIINVSGWEDNDKEGNKYADYFIQKNSYTISNIDGDRGTTGSENEIFLDLTTELPEEFKENFDVVFNHTTLEHIYDFHKAVKNLCSLSRDIVIIVVPFLQPVHWAPNSWYDYWRFTPFALEILFKKNAFEIVYLSYNDNPIENVYLFCVASRQPEKWKHVFPKRQSLKQENAPGMLWYTHSFHK